MPKINQSSAEKSRYRAEQEKKAQEKEKEKGKEKKGLGMRNTDLIGFQMSDRVRTAKYRIVSYATGNKKSPCITTIIILFSVPVVHSLSLVCRVRVVHGDGLLIASLGIQSGRKLYPHHQQAPIGESA